MEKYELVLLIRPDLEKNRYKDIIQKIENEIKNHGILLSFLNIGMKKTAYNYKGFNQGYYYIITFSTTIFEFPYELEKNLSTNDFIIRYMLVKSEN